MTDPVETPLILEARDVHKHYRVGARRLEVLKGVSLRVRRGEFVALRGASGAGKSTLLHLLGGLDIPSTGAVDLEGRTLGRLDDATLCRVRNRMIGFVFQAYHLFPEMDAVENVWLPARIGRSNRRELRARASELLSRVGLSDRLTHRPAELSGGEQQRVAIARALINEPSIILADEPTGNLDSHTGEAIVALLQELRAERNMTLIMATHDAGVANNAPRVVELEDGLVSADRRNAGTAAGGL